MQITAVLLYNNNLIQSSLEPNHEITFGSHKKDTVFIPGFEPQQIKIKWKANGVSVDAKKAYGYESNAVPINSIIILSKEQRVILYLSTLVGSSTQTVKLPYNCAVRIGRSDENDIVLRIPFISAKHFLLKSEDGTIRVEDLGSTNGLFLNGKRIGVAKMKSGDILDILSVRIMLSNRELHFYNVADRLTVKADFSKDENRYDTVLNRSEKQLTYRRSPRMQEKLPCEDIVLANAPNKGQKFEKSRGLFSSLAGTGAMFGASMLTSVASPALVAARAASLVSPVISVASSGGNNKKHKQALEQYEAMRREKYGAYIDDQKARIESVAKVQRDIITTENIPPRDCIDSLFELRRNLWERTQSDRDFLDVRVGMGYEDLCVNVKSRADSNGFQMEDDDVRELSEQIIEETRIVDNVPARISLLKNNTVGVVGNRAKTINLIRNMIIALTTEHCFEDVRIVGLFNENEKKEWEQLKWLPHIWDENKQFRYLAFNKEDTHNVCEILHELIKDRRKEKRLNSLNTAPVPKPYYIVIFGDKQSVEREPLMQELYDNDASLGITSMFLFNDMYSLPHDCKFIVDMDRGPYAFDCKEANKKFIFTPDPPISAEMMDAFARRMSAIQLDGFARETGIPNSVTFLQGYGVKTVEELDIIGRWQKAVPYKSLSVPIGVMAGGKTFKLDIHEKAHGPHGLVAGTTGSGKSELLQTWVLSMCVCYHPYDVSFVIIDYKGGGMANLLEPLPHVVGKITNIGANIGRSLISLQSEIKRRLAIFDRYGVNHIDKYQKLFKEGRASEPLPHLIIISDEFAELKKEEPEFMSGLISAARVGRSIGVHLVLATQKPGGVVDDQIQSNSRFRLCMKVQDVNDSREMIKRPDAAKITQCGRTYIRVGEDEYFDLFQSYWSGAPYMGSVFCQGVIDNRVRIIDDSGRRIKTVFREKTRFKSDVDELAVIVKHICAVAKENHIKKLNGPWLPELPERLAFENIVSDGVGFNGENWGAHPKWLKTPIGMYDSPKTQSQGIQFMDFALEGHYGIYGAPGTGKTSMLKTVVFSLCTSYSPNDINIYILDCGGWGMSLFSNMPHVGGVALDCEGEKFLKLEKLITEEIDKRKRIFLKNAVNSLSAYREAVSEDMPAIIIAIDNIVPVFELYPDLENFFVMLARDGATYGIYMVYTANSTSGVRYKVMQNIKGAIAFELTDKGDYAAVVGRLDGMTLPKINGRAFYKGNPPIEFQSALYANGLSDRDMGINIQDIISKMNSAWNGNRPKPIPVMPDEVTLKMLSEQYFNRTTLPVGIDYANINTAYFDLSQNYSLLISGSIQSGKSETLQLLTGEIAEKFADAKIFVFDSRKASLSGTENAYRYGTVQDDDYVTSVLNELVEHLNERQKAINLEKKVNGPDIDEKSFILKYELLCIVIDDLKDFVDSVSDANKLSMERICRLAKHLGVIVLCAGRVADITKYNEIESLTRVIVANQNGLVLDGSPAQYAFLQNNLKYNERDVELEDGNAYMFVAGKCSKIKLPKRGC